MFLQAFGHPLQPQTCDDDVALISLKRETEKNKKTKNKKENKKETNTKKRKHKRKEIVMEN